MTISDEYWEAEVDQLEAENHRLREALAAIDNDYGVDSPALHGFIDTVLAATSRTERQTP